MKGRKSITTGLSSPHFAKTEVRNLPSSLNSQNPRGTDRSPEVHPKGI